MNLFDRYITRNFLQAYLYCIIGFISIWFIFDISDSISTFLDQHVGFGRVLEYYGTQIPQILVILLPVSLLLALLFVLGRMSRANEIVSMLTAGIGLIRVLTPLFLLAILTTAVCFVLNYSVAPHAEMARKLFFAMDKSASGSEGQIFRNRRDSRTWFIQRLRPNSDVFDNVEVLQQDSSDHITMAFLAARAEFQPGENTWILSQAKVVHYDPAGNIISEQMEPTLVVSHWSETPYRLRSANMRAEFMSLPELRDYLSFNADFPQTLLAAFRTHYHYRIALPWTCLVVALRSEEHTSELQSLRHLVCRLLLEKKKKAMSIRTILSRNLLFMTPHSHAVATPIVTVLASTGEIACNPYAGLPQRPNRFPPVAAHS